MNEAKTTRLRPVNMNNLVVGLFSFTFMNILKRYWLKYCVYTNSLRVIKRVMTIFHHQWKNLQTILLMSALCSLLSCCSTLPPTRLKSILISAEIDANQDTATAIDFVFVYNRDAIPFLPKTGPAWFAQKFLIQSSLASNIDVVSVEIPPSTNVDVPLPSRHGKAIAVYSFVNYINVNGQYAGNLTSYEDVQIVLTPNTVLYKIN